jgi:hypothetical protein
MRSAAVSQGKLLVGRLPSQQSFVFILFVSFIAAPRLLSNPIQPLLALKRDYSLKQLRDSRTATCNKRLDLALVKANRS